MTPDNPSVVDPLAAEYVLGTLRGPARRRFERWRATSPLVQERCRFWEDNLMPLAGGLRGVRPPGHVWEGIRRRLNLPAARAPRRAVRPFAIAAGVVLVGLAALLYWRTTGPGTLSEVATIAAPAGTEVWRVEVYAERGRLIVHAGRPPSRPSNRDYELWALPAGGAPVSLGVLPIGGTAQRELTAAQRDALGRSAQIAVTLEQAGGSATGQPTSTPIYVAPLRAAS